VRRLARGGIAAAACGNRLPTEACGSRACGAGWMRVHRMAGAARHASHTLSTLRERTARSHTKRSGCEFHVSTTSLTNRQRRRRVWSSDHRDRVVLRSRLRRQAHRLHCGQRRPCLQAGERAVEACEGRTRDQHAVERSHPRDRANWAGEAVVRSSDHRTRVLLLRSRMRRQAHLLHCGHRCPCLQAGERVGGRHIRCGS
jgi:hypothetical protein